MLHRLTSRAFVNDSSPITGEVPSEFLNISSSAYTWTADDYLSNQTFILEITANTLQKCTTGTTFDALLSPKLDINTLAATLLIETSTQWTIKIHDILFLIITLANLSRFL